MRACTALPSPLVAFARSCSPMGSFKFPAASTSMQGSGSPPVVAGHKEVTNGEEIVTQLVLVGWYHFAVNHVECDAACTERTFKQLNPESGKAVTVGDDNVADITPVDRVQKGLQTPPLEVET